MRPYHSPKLPVVSSACIHARRILASRRERPQSSMSGERSARGATAVPRTSGASSGSAWRPRRDLSQPSLWICGRDVDAIHFSGEISESFDPLEILRPVERRSRGILLTRERSSHGPSLCAGARPSRFPGTEPVYRIDDFMAREVSWNSRTEFSGRYTDPGAPDRLSTRLARPSPYNCTCQS